MIDDEYNNLITHVSKENNLITDVQVCECSYCYVIRNKRVLSKEEIINEILKQGKKYFIGLRRYDSDQEGYSKEAQVRVVDKKYLRSDANKTKKDNLGELPDIPEETWLNEELKQKFFD